MLSRHRKGFDPLPVGAIIYIQDRVSPFSGVSWMYSCRAPWQILAWHNRECWGKYYRGGHLATVKSLRTGEIKQCADWILKACSDAGLDYCKGEHRASRKNNHAVQVRRAANGKGKRKSTQLVA